MKHDVTASIDVYLCFINNIKHYPSYIKCMFITMMLEGCGNAFVCLFVFLCEVCPNATDTLMPLDTLQIQNEEKKTSVIECQYTY